MPKLFNEIENVRAFGVYEIDHWSKKKYVFYSVYHIPYIAFEAKP